jgi:hypothetical protein
MQDAQAMARIWRDGQKRTCHIYRLLTTGLIDEKMFQRQLYKNDLVGFVGQGCIGGKASTKRSGSFSQEELRKLFEMNLSTACDTKDMLDACGVHAGEEWVNCASTVEDLALRAAVSTGIVSFVHLQKPTDVQPYTAANSSPVAGKPVHAELDCKADASGDEGGGANESSCSRAKAGQPFSEGNIGHDEGRRRVRQCLCDTTWAARGDAVAAASQAVCACSTEGAASAEGLEDSAILVGSEENGIVGLAKVLDDESVSEWDEHSVADELDGTGCLPLDSDSR